MPKSQDLVDTTIVVCTCSRVSLLRGALESLFQQDWASNHALELLVVDDGSTDATAELLVQLASASPFPLRVLAGPQAGIAAARNLGFSRARGQWVASFDDDQIASRGWLRALRERADRERAVCVGGALTLTYPSGVPDPPLGRRVRAILGEHRPYPAAQPYGAKTQPATNNALLRRDVFVTSGGFNVGLVEGGEDKDLFRRVRNAGHVLWFEPAATAGHITPNTRLDIRNLRWTSVRLGVSDVRIALCSSRLAVLRLAVTRLAVALLRDLPSRLRASPAVRLDARCSLWYTQGLLRGLRALLHPAASDPAFLQSLNFRARNGERPATGQAASRPSSSTSGPADPVAPRQDPGIARSHRTSHPAPASAYTP